MPPRLPPNTLLVYKNVQGLYCGLGNGVDDGETSSQKHTSVVEHAIRVAHS